MATTINNPIAVNVQAISSGTAAGSRTFTTTRPLRVFDMIARKDSTAVAGVAATLTISNAGNGITSVATPNPPVINTIYRLGSEIAASTCNDANMLVAAGGTIVFAVSTADTFDINAICYPG